MKLPLFDQKPGPITLNGPLVSGYACKVKVYVGEGVVMGVDVMVICPSPEMAEAIAGYLQDGQHKPAHVMVGQPPWYQNTTKENTLDDVTKPAEGAIDKRKAELRKDHEDRVYSAPSGFDIRRRGYL